MTRIGRATRLPLLAAVMLAVAGCASSGNAGGGGSLGTITRDQLLETRQSNLYQAVRALRPQWLRARGQTSLRETSQVMLYLNDQHYGTVDLLINIPIEAVLDVRFISAAEAAGRFGTMAGTSGVVVVRTAT